MISLLFLTPAMAQAETGQPNGTRINLSATVETELPNDEVVVSFRIEKEGKNADQIRTYVNKVSDSIGKRLSREKGVKYKTTGRNMQPVWQHPKNSPRIRTSWKMTQSGQIISTNLDAVPGWLDAIEADGANLSNLEFRISSSESKKAQEQLRLQAINLFRNKAEVIAKGLSARSFRIIRLNTSSQSSRPVMYRAEMAMMAKAADAAPPALSSGEGKIGITVSGEIEVPFTDFPSK